MRELQFPYRLGHIHKCFWRKGLVSMRNHSSYSFLFPWDYLSQTNSSPYFQILLPWFFLGKILKDTLQKCGNIFPSTVWNLSFLSFWGVKNTAVILLLLQEREPYHFGFCKTGITKPPSRELQPHNIQLPIIYSVARFSAGINQVRFLAFNQVKLSYASWPSGPACITLAQC